MNKTAQYTFTILVPFYNEEDNIYRLEKVLGDFLKISIIPSVAVLFIDDGSTDKGLELVKEVCERNEHFYYISLARNTGLSGALKAGFDNTWSKYVGYIDADLQTSPEDFNLLLPHAEEYPLVMGIRANRKDSFFKNLQSKIANGFRRMMTHDNAIDTGCPLKVFQTEYAKRIPMFNGMHRFFPALAVLHQEKESLSQLNKKKGSCALTGHSFLFLYNHCLLLPGIQDASATIPRHKSR